MRNFIIFFSEKSGTSPLVRLLDKFELISVVRQKDKTGFEPFDRHNCGRMSLVDLKQCLDTIYGRGPRNTETLNRIYTKKAKRPLAAMSEKGVVGFKMRFSAPRPYPFHIDRFPAWNKLSGRLFREHYMRSFRNAMFDILKRHNVVVLLAVRQDVLRLGLSIYHGDGTGKPGHLQFKLARGVIDRDAIGKINVDCEQLETIISKCEAMHAEKRLLMEELMQAGIQTHPILYEEFVASKRDYLMNLFRVLELEIPDDELSSVLSEEEYVKKVHSDNISEFVENHEEVLNTFSDRFVSWR
jgi:hypothetical protein